MPPLREITTLLAQIDHFAATTVPVFKEALSFQYGITRRSSLWDFPGAQLNTQLLGELMHCEAEGELPKHFSLLIPKFQAADPLFFVKLNTRTHSYFEKMKVAFPSIATLEKWRWHTNAADRLRFCLHSVHLLAPFVKDSFEADFALWRIHVRFVQLLTQHNFESTLLPHLQSLPLVIQRGIVKLYGGDHLTINSHWTLHLFLFVMWHSVMRLYWTFPQESLLHKMKNITKKMTNHKATSFSCVRLFVFDRQLNLFFHPMAHITKKNDLTLGPVVQINELAGPLAAHGLVKTPQDTMNTKCAVTKEYQLYRDGTVAATSAGLRMIKDILIVDQVVLALVCHLTEIGRTSYGLQRFTMSAEVFLERENFLHRCFGAWEGGEFVLNFEEK
jgi:hypothetical protein